MCLFTCICLCQCIFYFYLYLYCTYHHMDKHSVSNQLQNQTNKQKTTTTKKQHFAASLAGWLLFNSATPSGLEGDLLRMATVCTVTPPTVLQNTAGITDRQWAVKAQTCYQPKHLSSREHLLGKSKLTLCTKLSLCT